MPMKGITPQTFFHVCRAEIGKTISSLVQEMTLHYRNLYVYQFEEGLKKVGRKESFMEKNEDLRKVMKNQVLAKLNDYHLPEVDGKHKKWLKQEEENVELQKKLNQVQPFEFYDILQSAASSSINMGIFCEKIEEKLSKEQNPKKDHKNQIDWMNKVSKWYYDN